MSDWINDSELDKDRLDANVLVLMGGKEAPRWSGITTAILFLMLGEVWGGDKDNTYIYTSPFRHNMRQIMVQFHAMVEEYSDVKVLSRSVASIRLDNGQEFLFIDMDDMSGGTRLRGRRICELFDDSPAPFRYYPQHWLMLHYASAFGAEVIG